MGRDADEPRGSSLKRLAVLLAIAFVVTMSVVVGTRLSSDAIAILVGVIAGVGASIPTALLLMAVTRRQELPREDSEPYDERRQAPPPIIVVTPGATPQQQLPYSSGYSYPVPAPAPRRQFRVVGYDAEDEQAAGEAKEQDAWRW